MSDAETKRADALNDGQLDGVAGGYNISGAQLPAVQAPEYFEEI